MHQPANIILQAFGIDYPLLTIILVTLRREVMIKFGSDVAGNMFKLLKSQTSILHPSSILCRKATPPKKNENTSCNTSLNVPLQRNTMLLWSSNIVPNKSLVVKSAKEMSHWESSCHYQVWKTLFWSYQDLLVKINLFAKYTLYNLYIYIYIYMWLLKYALTPHVHLVNICFCLHTKHIRIK